MIAQFISRHRIGIIAVAVILAFSALAALAQSNPLVPCGRSGGVSCNLCDLYVLAKNVIDFALYWLALPITVIIFLWGGILLLTSRGSEEQLKQGKSALTNAVLGIIIAFAAWLIINTLLVTLGFGVPFTKGALPWNQFPTCEAPIATTFIPPVQQVACIHGKDPIRTCTTLNGSRGQQVCSSDGFWSACVESCDVADVGKTKQCTIGGCNGSQTCTKAGEAAYWSECADDPNDACIPKLGGGTCTPTQQGNCAVNNLAGICFGNLAAEASQICLGESHGDPLVGCKSDIDKSPTGESICWGLFQVHLKFHKVAGLDCPAAIEASGNPKHPWQVKNDATSRKLYNDCVAALKDPTTNIKKACEIRTARGNWHDWFNTANNCKLPV